MIPPTTNVMTVNTTSPKTPSACGLQVRLNVARRVAMRMFTTPTTPKNRNESANIRGIDIRLPPTKKARLGSTETCYRSFENQAVLRLDWLSALHLPRCDLQ